MKTLQNFFYIFFSILFLYSCSDDENVTPIEDNYNSAETFFKAKFNGTEFNGSGHVSSIVNNQLTLTSTQGGNTFRIQIQNVAVGVYNPNDAGVLLAYQPAGSSFSYVGKNADELVTGQINILKIDYTNKLVSGTFKFTGYWNEPNSTKAPINFTNGFFNNITFQSNIVPPPPADQVFSCNFDSQTFFGNEISAYYFQNNLYIIAKRIPQNDEFLLIVYGAQQGGSYNPNNSDQVYLMYQPANTEYVYWAYHPDDPNAVTGNITISNLDLINNKVSGTFNFNGSWSDTTQPSSKAFSNGVFDNIAITMSAPPSNDQFFCKVNNVDFNPSDIQVAEVTFGTEVFFAISGVKTTDRVNINIHEDLGVGSHPISLTGEAQASFIRTTPDFTLRATSGTIVIVEKTPLKIKGTFSYTTESSGGNGPFTITEGTFDVEL